MSQKNVKPQAQGEIDMGMTGAEPDSMAPWSIERSAPAKWEFLTQVNAAEADISRYGDEGWELVSVRDHGFNESIYYFKRPKN